MGDRLQENTTVALTKKCELDRFCSICLERMKDHVSVPCGKYAIACVHTYIPRSQPLFVLSLLVQTQTRTLQHMRA